MKAKIISIFTQKGGVGKTVSTINISGALAEMGYKTLVLDVDAQANASLVGYAADPDIQYTIVDFINSSDEPIYSRRGKDDKVHVISGSLELVTPKNKDVLKKAIKKVENDFDYILIDCPPQVIKDKELSFGEIALFACDYIICPVECDEFSLDGLTKLIIAVNKLRSTKGLKAEYLGFFFTKVEEHTVDFKEAYKELSESQIKDLLFLNYIRKNKFIRTSLREGESAVFLKAHNPVSMDYRKLTGEILSKIKK
ncbi:ParA family protein [Chryseobacterium nematophagum]|uniref:ParA family protein n=1 Tax=Chryseobacterium nematophagum TaxID=2305228 RepID=A0A3M7LEZ6_9FLAO|nr:ParA family protein [Chryseobacterium nematophagum]RMZ61271.1 ParA family protein [Chryseobacterium nematophagum]